MIENYLIRKGREKLIKETGKTPKKKVIGSGRNLKSKRIW